MATNTTSITERFTELTALAAVSAALSSLSDLAKEPSTKRYNRSAEARRERWFQIANLAEQQAGHTATAPAKKTRRPTVAATAVPITQGEVEEKSA